MPAILKLGTALVQRLKYGKQIGKMSKSGLLCFQKGNIKKTVQYTTIDPSSGKILTKKIINHHGNNCTNGTVFDANNNITSVFEHYSDPMMSGHASNNKFAKKLRTIRDEYNKYGQHTFHSDVTLFPTQKPDWLEINSLINDKTAAYCFKVKKQIYK